jgi:TatA/E family protein of Tat protein translocase
MFGLGMQELILILVVALLVIGPKKLPDIARALGKAMREFRRATDDIKQNFDMEPIDLDPKSTPKSVQSPLTEDKKETTKSTPDQKKESDNVE